MSMNAFRTHTRPLPPLWANICDENGTMILAEFPCLYNYQDYKFTPEEYAIWHRNVLSDAAGWMGRLWNHPAVVMWVLSNESNRDGEWEKGPYHDFVRALDPTRPTMRTGDTGTAENYDVHTCGNVEDTLEGNLIPGIGSWFREAKGRPVTNSEYMNYFGRPATQWTGKEDKEADALACAQIGMEHTEAMRRARLDGMLPYMYAGWTRTRLAARVRETGKGSAVWKAGYASPLSACWHSSLSPVLASLDLFDPNYLTGQEVRTDLYLINDSWHDATIHVDLLLTEEVPRVHPGSRVFRPARGEVELRFHAEGRHADEDPHHLEAAGARRKLLADGPYDRPPRPAGAQPAVRPSGAAAGSACGSARPPLRRSGRRCRCRCLVPITRAAGRARPGRTARRAGMWSSSGTPTHLTADEKRQAGLLREFAAGGRSRGRAGHPLLGLDRAV